MRRDIRGLDMNLKQFKYVLVLSREGSFSRAAEELNISQPSLSQYVKKIENDLGIALFDRTGGNVRLTDAGRVYIDIGRKMLDLEHRMSVEFSDLAENKTGSVIVGTSPYRSAGMMPLIAKRFQELYPRMHIVVEEHVTSDLIDGLARGEFDLCVLMLPVDDRTFDYEYVVEEELLLAVPASAQPLDAIPMEGRRYDAVDIREIKGKGFVTITETQLMQRLFDSICAEHEITTECAAVVKSLEAQIAMVRAGVGMAIVPSGIERFCGDGEVRFYSFAQELPRRDVVAVWRHDRPLSKAARDLVQIMKECFS